MNINYVIISSDDNPLYKGFYPIVAKKWYDLGFKTYYVNITDEDSVVENEFGIVHKIKALDFVSTSFQAQVVRLFACNLVEGNLLMSDIDMLPLNREYFSYKVNLLGSGVTKPVTFVVFSGQPYQDVPYYPMCYILANSESFQNSLGIKKLSFSDYCKFLLEKYGEKWNTDEHFLYDRIKDDKGKIVFSRDFNNRIDRSNWGFNKELLKRGHYFDSHLLRPYSQYKNEIDGLIRDAS